MDSEVVALKIMRPDLERIRPTNLGGGSPDELLLEEMYQIR